MRIIVSLAFFFFVYFDWTNGLPRPDSSRVVECHSSLPFTYLVMIMGKQIFMGTLLMYFLYIHLTFYKLFLYRGK